MFEEGSFKMNTSNMTYLFNDGSGSFANETVNSSTVSMKGMEQFLDMLYSLTVWEIIFILIASVVSIFLWYLVIQKIQKFRSLDK